MSEHRLGVPAVTSRSARRRENHVRNIVITQPARLSCQFGGGWCFRNKPTGSHASWAGPRTIRSFQPQQRSQGHFYFQAEDRIRDLLQRLGTWPTYCLPPWLAAQLRRLGCADDVLRRAGVSRGGNRPARPWALEPGV